MTRAAAVVIGRNEGTRLVRCLESLTADFETVVYVDSGSSDGSVATAKALGARVVELDPGKPFTAARARNEGLFRLTEGTEPPEYVQFLDGDCELQPGWLQASLGAITDAANLAVVCGRRRERTPAASPYNQLADLEWDTPVGEARACGGDALMRVEALQGVGAFDASLIAGEEPELCLRLRRAGWRVLRIDAEMTLHDADMKRFGQWWRRQARAGHAYAEGFWRHRAGREGFRRRELVSILAWTLGLPLLALLACFVVGPPGAVLLLGYPVLWVRIAARRPGHHRGLWASGCVLGKFAQLQGAATFAWHHGLRSRATPLMEYKSG